VWRAFLKLAQENPEQAEFLAGEIHLEVRPDLIAEYRDGLATTGIVRETSIACLSRLGSDESVAALVAAFEGEKDEDVKDVFLAEFAHCQQHPQILKCLLAAVESPDDFSSAAVKTLATGGEPEERADLMSQKLLQAKSSVARGDLIRGLGVLAGRGSKTAEMQLVEIARISTNRTDRMIAYKKLKAAHRLSSLTESEIADLEALK